MRRRSPQRHLSLVLRLLVLVRVLAVVLGVQISGMGAAATEAAHALGGEVDCSAEQCPSDRPCDDCPASCPNCHCANGIVSVVPTVAVAPVAAFVGVRQPRESFVATAPLVPDLAGVFRPPCALAVS